MYFLNQDRHTKKPKQVSNGFSETFVLSWSDRDLNFRVEAFSLSVPKVLL